MERYNNESELLQALSLIQKRKPKNQNEQTTWNIWLDTLTEYQILFNPYLNKSHSLTCQEVLFSTEMFCFKRNKTKICL